jgi:hypothetical protein
MSIIIDQKIVSCHVLDDKETSEIKKEDVINDNIVQMHEKLERPEMLVGSTYKIKPALSEHAMYITMNDIVLNQGTDHELRRPFEIFINSKNMENFQWILALTRVASAVFRKGGDCTFLVEELKAVFDPKGGYWKSGGKYMPSIVAEIGEVIEKHLLFIGLLVEEGADLQREEFLKSKREEYDSQEDAGSEKSDFPKSASLCNKCMTKAVIVMDNCKTCLNCGDSKCG